MMEWFILGLSLLFFLVSLPVLFWGIRAGRSKRNLVGVRNELLESAGDLMEMTYFSCDMAGSPDKKVSDARFWEQGHDGRILSEEEWIMAEDLPGFKASWRQFLQDQSSPRLKIGYRAGINGKMDFFEMRAERRLSLVNGHEEIFGLIRNVTMEKRQEHERQVLMDDLADYAEQQRLMSVILERIAVDEQDDRVAMKKVLEVIAGRLGATRGYLFCTDWAENRSLPEMEWCDDKSELLLEQLPVLLLNQDEHWLQTLLRHKIFHVRSDAGFGGDGESVRVRWETVLTSFKCRSAALAGVWRDKQLWGYLAFGFAEKKVQLSELERTMLASAAHVIEIIQERQRNREELSRSEYEKRLIIDKIKIPVMLFDAEMKLVRVNNAAVEVAGLPEEEIYRRPCFSSFCGSANWRKECPAVQASKDLCDHSEEIKIRERTYLISAHPVIADGKLVNVLKTLIDVTDFNNVQRRLTQALLDTQNANKAKSFFLATMSHELRTPLNAVIGFSELLSDNSMSEEERLEAVHSINLAGKSLLSLINDVLDLSKIEAEQMNIIPHPTDVLELCREIEAIFRHKLNEKKLSFVIDCPETLPTLLLDSLRLRQILLNLVGNAIKFTDHGSIRVTIGFVPDSARSGLFSLHVIDTGIGVRPECQRKIFDPFVQEDYTQGIRRSGGTGLGLAISSRLAGRMGGTLKLESEPGKGSDFILELANVEFVAPAPQISSMPVCENTKKDSPCRGRVLVVDDVEMNLLVLSAMLRRIHYDVVTAGSAHEALAWLAQETPDWILSDLWMPEMNGEEFVRQLRKNPRCQNVRVTAVTADGEAAENFDLGLFDNVLLKPVTLEKLKKIIDMKSVGRTV